MPTYGTVFPDCWIHVGIAVPVFLCFGWGKDANSVYRSWLRLLGFARLFPALAKSDSHSLPSPVTNKKVEKNGSSASSRGQSDIE